METRYERFCAWESLLILPLTVGLAGCAAIPLKHLQPLVDPPNTSCGTITPAKMLRGESAAFHYEIVPAAGAVSLAATAPVRFEDFRQRVKSNVQSRLPEALKNQKVALRLTDFLTAVSGQAQVNAAYAEQRMSAEAFATEQKSIEPHLNAPNIGHGEMKEFAMTLFDSQMRRGAASLTGLPADHAHLSAAQVDVVKSHAGGDNSFVAYFEAYYKGKFVDRMGTTFGPPKLSGTVTDTEITDAETVLLEFLMDSIDRTPVMGNRRISDVTKLPSGILFYPGGTGAVPTVLLTRFPTDPAVYLEIKTPPTTGENDLCGITTGNAWVLKDLALGAGSEAGAVGGLVTGTFGGISVIGKISIGDNQTLSLMVKTAATRVATRATLAASYWTLRNVKFNVEEP